jgi:rhamnosyltransferase
MEVSIVIPVKNGVKWLRDSLPVFCKQQLTGEYEIILLDSESTDGLAQLVAAYPKVKVHTLPSGSFNHGDTRNEGVKIASGRYITLTVQDAKPVNENWLAELLNGFTDEEVVAVCGQQIVPHHPDKNPIEWFRPLHAPNSTRIQFTPDEYEQLTGAERLKVARLDDVVCCYRRDALLQMPFRRTEFAEDAFWANDALKRGWALVYNTNARIEHYHFCSEKYLHHRKMIEWYTQYLIFGLLPQPPVLTLKKIGSWVKIVFISKEVIPTKKFFWLMHNLSVYFILLKTYKEWQWYYQHNNIEGIYQQYFSNIPIGSSVT